VKLVSLDIRLREHFPRDADDAWGSSEGQAVREKLSRLVEAHPEATVIRISLKGVRKTDASFARESVLELAYQLRGRRGVCVIDMPSKDVLDNWHAAAVVREQTLVVWHGKEPQLIGPKPSADTWELLRYVLKQGDVTTAEAAKALHKQVNNVSTRLKRMTDEGLVLRREVNAPSGGLEYRYLSIC
jgi:hypothetical protein